MPVATESCACYFCIDRSLRSNRAVVEAQSCGRLRPIVRLLKPNRAVVAFALTSQCEDIV